MIKIHPFLLSVLFFLVFSSFVLPPGAGVPQESTGPPLYVASLTDAEMAMVSGAGVCESFFRSVTFLYAVEAVRHRNKGAAWLAVGFDVYRQALCK